ncbi:MAG: hypothetical protein ABIZ81_06060 [Opitutaceae bacterium]
MTAVVFAALSAPSLLGWLLLIGAFAGVFQALRAEPSPPRGVDWKWWLLILGILLTFRWPLICQLYEIHQDESVLMAGAMTLRHDPVFWRSVDGATAGPLNFYALLPAVFAPGLIPFAMTRITAVLLIWGAIMAVGETLALKTSRVVARSAVLPLILFESFTTSVELAHYSTELVPNFLLMGGAYGVARQSRRPSRRGLWLTSFLLGAVPFAKLQAIPIAAAIWLFLVVQEIRAGRKSCLPQLLIVSLLPTLAVSSLVVFTGETENLIIPYFLNNLAYAQAGRESLAPVVAQLWSYGLVEGFIPLLFIGSGLGLLPGVMLAQTASGSHRRLALAALGLLVIATACALAPHREYPHYLNFMLPPLALLSGAALAVTLGVAPTHGAQMKRAHVLLALFLLSAAAPQIALRASNRPDRFSPAFRSSEPSEAHRQLSDLVRTLGRRGEALGLWGWRSSLYVETGLHQATRQAHTESQFKAGPLQPYFLRRYLADLQASRPPVFVDTAGPGNFRFDDRGLGHQQFPQLRDWVGAHYTLVADIDGVRVYARNDRAAAFKPGP